MTTDRIPFLDLAAHHRDLHDELMSVFEVALDSSRFVDGGMVQADLSLPMFPELRPEQQHAVARAVRDHIG